MGTLTNSVMGILINTIGNPQNVYIDKQCNGYFDKHYRKPIKWVH